MRRYAPALLGCLTTAVLTAACADAQSVPRSQLGTVTQVVAGNRIEVVYRRPVARGRELFGALVPWSRIWSPSADSTAQFRVTRTTEIEGHPLPAGSYGIWAIPDSTAWTVIFSRVPSAFHLRYPRGRDALRVRAVPARGEYVETLEFDFPVVDADSAVLRLRWGNTVVPLKIRSR
jgi:hypothetical protein